MKTSLAHIATAVVAAVALSVAVPTVGYAAPGSGHTPHAGTTTTTPKSVREYRLALTLIGINYRSAVAAAKARLRSALAVARTPGTRNTARVKFSLAIAVATNARDAALVRLGRAPAKRTAHALGDRSTAFPSGSS